MAHGERGRGLSWAPPWRTEIPNPASKVWLARLTDGRIALVRPSPTARDPLSLWLSEDEMRTWPVRVELDSWSANEAWFARARGPVPSTALAYPTRCRRAGRCTSSTTSAGGTSCTWRSTWPGSERAQRPARRVIQITAPAGETP